MLMDARVPREKTYPGITHTDTCAVFWPTTVVSVTFVQRSGQRTKLLPLPDPISARIKVRRWSHRQCQCECSQHSGDTVTARVAAKLGQCCGGLEPKLYSCARQVSQSRAPPRRSVRPVGRPSKLLRVRWRHQPSCRLRTTTEVMLRASLKQAPPAKRARRAWREL